jgi:sugar phosphate isomerase/epimerase
VALNIPAGFTYHIVPETQKNPRALGALLEPLFRDGFWKTFQIPPLPSNDAVRELTSQLRLAGIRPTFDIGGTVSDGELRLQSTDSGVRAAALETAKDLVDQAILLGAEVADINPGPDPGPDDRPRELAHLADSLKRLCDYAAHRGKEHRRRPGDPAEAEAAEAKPMLTISLEHFDRDVDKKRILGPTEEAAEFVAEIRRRVPNIGLTMDLSHLILLGEDPGSAVTTAGEYVTNAHLSNCILSNPADPRWGDRHPPFFVPGGSIDVTILASFISSLRTIGYFDALPGASGMLTFQVKPAAWEDPALVAAACRRLLDRASSMLA